MIKENITNKENLITYDKAIESTAKEVDRILSTSPMIIRGYTEHLIKSKGKFIRATSLIVCAQDEEGFVHPNAVKFAASVELLHLATLVHDDIIDDADLRRGEITLQKRCGKKTAVICGDYLLAIALQLAASVPNKEDYINLDMPDYITKVCLGELNQHINNFNLDLSIIKYLNIISGKTAALFEASFYAGAVLCKNEEALIKKYKRLGRYIGMLFQITDDCMDFEESVDMAKKPVQSDYEQGVITLPLIYALRNDESLKEKAKNKNVTKEDINSAVLKSGGLKLTHLLAKNYYNKSLKLIDELHVNEDKYKKLKFVLDKSYRLL